MTPSTASSARATSKSSSGSPNGARPGQPPWRRLVNRVDRLIASPAEGLMRNNSFTDSMAIAARLEVQIRRRLERQSTWLLHKANLPTAGDIRRVQAQVAAVEARVRDLSEQLDEPASPPT